MQIKYLNAMKERLNKIRVVTQSKSNPLDENDDVLLRCIYFGKQEESNEPKMLSHKEKNAQLTVMGDDIQRLNEYSLMTAGARYELLNANRLLLDIDIGMQVYV